MDGQQTGSDLSGMRQPLNGLTIGILGLRQQSPPAPLCEKRFLNGRRALVAAGVILRRDQDQARARRLRLRLVADCVQNPHEGRVSGENAKTHGYDYRDAQDQRHEERDHLSLTLFIDAYEAQFPQPLFRTAKSLSLNG
jgi:hypothetical protein